jgi:hypothetical protein
VMDRLYGLRAHAVLVSAVVLGEPAREGSQQRGTVLGLSPDGSLLFQPENAEPLSVYGGELQFDADP